MLDQSFTAENFRKIFDYENRKGVYLEGKFFPALEEIARELKGVAVRFKELKKERKQISTTEYKQKKNELNLKKDTLKSNKEILLTQELERLAKEITSNNFKVVLQEVQPIKGKRVFTIDKGASSYFALKQVQNNIHRLYKVKQSNRHNIVCQLREILKDKFPKYIIRADIQNFYESIPRERLIQKINKDSLLTQLSKRIIKQILACYGEMTNSLIGIPRGIGLSAYLSELYLRELDELIKMQRGVIYYARYVDDVVVVYSHGPNSDFSDGQRNVEECIRKLGLEPSPTKKNAFDLRKPGNVTLKYLGYQLSFGTGGITIDLSTEKIGKYKKRLQLSFDAYKKSSKSNEKRARKLLVKRIRFLTSNTRLLNNKKRVQVGVYFSNSLITCSKSLAALDIALKRHLESISENALRSRLESMSFVEGFRSKIFSNFTPKDLMNVVEVWSNVS